MTRRVVLVVGAVLALAFVALDTAPFASRPLDRGQIVGRDFALFRGAGELALRGEFDGVWDGARVARAAEGPGGVAPRAFTYFAYPPPMLLVCVPLARLPYGVAFAAWLVGGAALLVVAAGGRRRAWPLLLAPAVLLHLDLGQSGLLVAALLVGGLRCVDARPWRGGFLLGLLVVKPTLALLVPVALLAGGRGRAVAGAVLGACVCVAATLVVFGSGPFEAWVASVPFEAARAYLERGFGPGRWMSVSAFTGVRLLGGSVAAGYVVQAAFALATAILVAARWREGADRTTRVAAVLIGSAAMSPYLHTWDLVAATAGTWMLAARAPRPMSPTLAALATAAWLAPIGAPFLAWAHLPLAPLLYPCLLAVHYAQVRRG